MAVVIAASTAYSTPVSTPVVTLVVDPGRYKFTDFVKLGTPLLPLTYLATLLVAPLIFPVYPTCETQQNRSRRLDSKIKSSVIHATQGFIAAPDFWQIKNADGAVVWDMERYKFFLEEKAYPSIHPSLQRQSTLNMNYGLYEVMDGVYQVRGFDLANISFVKGDTGWIIFDPLTAEETARAALELVNEKLGKFPVKAVVYADCANPRSRKGHRGTDGGRREDGLPEHTGYRGTVGDEYLVSGQEADMDGRERHRHLPQHLHAARRPGARRTALVQVHQRGVAVVGQGGRAMEAQIADGTAKVEGDTSILGKLASTLVVFDPRFEIMPGTADKPTKDDLNDYEVGPVEVRGE